MLKIKLQRMAKLANKTEGKNKGGASGITARNIQHDVKVAFEMPV